MVYHVLYIHITPINPSNDSWTFLFIIWGLSGGPGKRISSKAVIRNGLLTIPSVDRSDEGEYICKALNTHGEHTARGVLHVQSTHVLHRNISRFAAYQVPEPDEWVLLCFLTDVSGTGQPHGLPVVQVSPPRVELHEGETLRLYCRAVGNPTPALTWKKRGGSLPPQVRNRFLLLSFILLLNEAF